VVPCAETASACSAGDGEGAFRLGTDPASASDLASQADVAQGDVAAAASTGETGNGGRRAEESDNGALREGPLVASTSAQESASLALDDGLLGNQSGSRA